MKVKVLKKFIDKHTGKVHEPSKKGTFLTITKERYEEIISVDEGLVEVVADEVPAEKKTTKKAAKKVAE